MREHQFGEIPNNRFRLEVKLAQHFIDASVVDQLDDVAMESRTDNRHGTCGAGGSSRDILGFKSQVLAAELDSGLEGLGDYCGRYVFPPPCRRHEWGQGGGG